MIFRHKAKKTSLQITITENLDNNEDPRRNINGSNLNGSKKRQDLLSKLGAWEPWVRIKGKGEEEKGAEKNVELYKIN